MPERLVLDCDTGTFHVSLDLVTGHPMSAPLKLYDLSANPAAAPGLLSTFEGDEREVAFKFPILRWARAGGDPIRCVPRVDAGRARVWCSVHVPSSQHVAGLGKP